MVDEKSVKDAVFVTAVTSEVDGSGVMSSVVAERSGIKVTVCVSVTTFTGEASKEILKPGKDVDVKDICSGIMGVTDISGISAVDGSWSRTAVFEPETKSFIKLIR